MKRLRITVEGKVYDVTVEVLDDGAPAASPPALPVAAPSPPAPFAATPATATDGAVVSQLAGTVVSVAVTVGEAVAQGQALLVLEAMKMNTTILAPRAGTVRSIAVQQGAAVEEGQVLLTLS